MQTEVQEVILLTDDFRLYQGILTFTAVIELAVSIISYSSEITETLCNDLIIEHFDKTFNYYYVESMVIVQQQYIH